MTFALDKNNDLIEATPNRELFCPNCKRKVFSKCGEIRVWHWSHHISESCELSKIIDSVWRYEWIKKTNKEKVEKVINGQIVDVLGLNQAKVLFVSGKIEESSIRACEKALCDRIIWVLKSDVFKLLRIYSDHYKCEKKPGHYYFEWKRPRKEWSLINPKISHLFFDVGIKKKYYKRYYDQYENGEIKNRLLYVKKIYNEDDMIVGEVVEMEEDYFIERYM